MTRTVHVFADGDGDVVKMKKIIDVIDARRGRAV